ncbi:hypothetical protein [Spiroplasma sp. SV19]|uniref:hypothetical protein n=1 Tax=Spiroplasma sp. SV19 TaxID=2570468 RepID=UPI0024B72790|nr:hypothetical protein [Spiroplasma sp. SV19]WHQ37224.1 hypothetical protein E7Y35_04980 [Spiroplasma sp. SV19]
MRILKMDFFLLKRAISFWVTLIILIILSISIFLTGAITFNKDAKNIDLFFISYLFFAVNFFVFPFLFLGNLNIIIFNRPILESSFLLITTKPFSRTSIILQKLLINLITLIFYYTIIFSITTIFYLLITSWTHTLVFLKLYGVGILISFISLPLFLFIIIIASHFLKESVITLITLFLAIIVLITPWLMAAKNIKHYFSTADHNVINIIKEHEHPAINLFKTNETYTNIYHAINKNDGNEFHQIINKYLEKNNYQKILHSGLFSEAIDFNDLKRTLLFDVNQDVTVIQPQSPLENVQIILSKQFSTKIKIYQMFYQQDIVGIDPSITKNPILWSYRYSWQFQKKMFMEIKKKHALNTEVIITSIFQQLHNAPGHSLFINFSEYIDNYKKVAENNKYKTGILALNLFSQYTLAAAKLIDDNNFYHIWGYSNFFNNEFNWYKLDGIIYNINWNNTIYTRPTWPLVFPLTIIFIFPAIGLYYFLQRCKYK